MSTIRAAIGATVLAIAVPCAPLAAQKAHVLIVTGLSGEPQYAKTFNASGAALHETAKTKWGVPDESLYYLAEDTAADKRINGRSTRDAIGRAFGSLSQRVAGGDILFVFLLGHGSGEGPLSSVSLPGPDPTANDFKGWLVPFAKQTVVFVNASSASGDFVQVLGAPGRVIVTATKTALERNESVFASHFVLGFASGESDADKDGKTSVREAFDYAKKEVAKYYEAQKKLMTEHAAISDSVLAQSVTFGGEAASNDPRVAALVAQRKELEDQLNALRLRKAQMEVAAYELELERLVTAIAVKTESIRALRGGK